MRYFVTRQTAVLTLVALILIAIGLVYISTPATHLPSFFPGHVAHARHARPYSKRGVVALIVAFVLLLIARHESSRAMGDN